MADQIPAWMMHAISDNVTTLAQQRQSKAMSAVRVQEGVVGKSYPFHTLSTLDLAAITARDGDTQYLNPTMGKRRAQLLDFGAAVLIDEFDTLKTMTDPQSEFAKALAFGRNRKIDDLLLGVAGLGSAGASGTAVGGILGLATLVNESGESTSTSALPTAQQIVNGSANLTMAKLRTAKQMVDEADEFDSEDWYFFYSPDGMNSLLADPQVTSSDYSTIQALQRGGFPQDQMWMGFKWRMSNRLPKASNIRSLIAVNKSSVGFAVGLIKGVEIDRNPAKWNNNQVVIKLSGGAVRIEDKGVIQLDIDESVA
jgi:hypothetical protein